MAVHMLTTPYQSAGEAQALKNWLGQTVAIRLDKANTVDKDGRTVTSSIRGVVFTGADDDGAPVLIESARIIGQLANGFEIGDTVIAHVVEYGKRGQVLAPPADKDKDAAVLSERFPVNE